MTQEINFLQPISTVGHIFGAPGSRPAQEGLVALGLCQALQPMYGPGGHFILLDYAVQAALALREEQLPIMLSNI